MPICFWLLTHLMSFACCLVLLSAGKSSEARIAMMVMTTSSSMRVNACRPGAPPGTSAPHRPDNAFVFIPQFRMVLFTSIQKQIAPDHTEVLRKSSLSQHVEDANCGPRLGLSEGPRNTLNTRKDAFVSFVCFA